ncbi:odorant receptor 94a-like [Eurosta solidaginis]|uniref:odorant receptor 94a-like n=1 Tax=Eurosta solidaginis TaxID=178769 RepID=UPI003530F9FB
MQFDNIYGARLVIRILRFVGLWHLNDSTKSLYIAYSYILHLTISFPHTTMMWVDVVQISSLEKFSYVMYMALTQLGMLAKVANVWLNSKLLMNFFDVLANAEMLSLHSDAERKLWSNAHRYFRRVVLAYVSMSLMALSIAFLSVLLKDEYELPFPYAPPFDWHNERGYWLAYGYELLAMPVTCLSNCGIDMIQCYMFLHLSLCYKMIAGRLKEMGKLKRQLSLPNQFSETRLLEDLAAVMKLHERTKRRFKDCESFVSFSILIQIMFSSFVLCFSAYRLQKIRFLENPTQFSVLILAVMVMTLQIFLPCYFGNEIILSSGALNSAIYKADWIQCSPKIRKYLIIYMEMLQMPVKIRAGGFFEIGLPVFVKTINNTYSLMALLLNMNK